MPTDFIPRIQINDRSAFGKIVMEWSRGERQVPTNLEEAEAQLNGIIDFPLPDYILGIQVIPSTKEVWTIKLPPADMLDDRAARIADGQHYDAPIEYRDHFDGTNTLSPTDMFQFRVGDYTCSLCG